LKTEGVELKLAVRASHGTQDWRPGPLSVVLRDSDGLHHRYRRGCGKESRAQRV